MMGFNGAKNSSFKKMIETLNERLLALEREYKNISSHFGVSQSGSRTENQNGLTYNSFASFCPLLFPRLLASLPDRLRSSYQLGYLTTKVRCILFFIIWFIDYNHSVFLTSTDIFFNSISEVQQLRICLGRGVVIQKTSRPKNFDLFFHRTIQTHISVLTCAT